MLTISRHGSDGDVEMFDVQDFEAQFDGCCKQTIMPPTIANPDSDRANHTTEVQLRVQTLSRRRLAGTSASERLAPATACVCVCFLLLVCLLVSVPLL